MPLLSEVLLQGKKPRRGNATDQARAAAGVVKNLDWKRIRTLPFRELDLESVVDLTPVFEREDCGGCELCARGPARLRPVQSAMLWEAEAAGGLLALVGVGHGKELATLLLPEAVGAERAIILTKPRLKTQMLETDIPRYGRHFRIDRSRFRVVSYSELSTAKGTDLLERYKPDWIIANECHALRHKDTARGKRFLRFMHDHPDTRFCALSGTMANGSPRDYEHLARLALRGGSPLPHGFRDVDDWSRALEEGGGFGVGAILELLGEEAAVVEYTKAFMEIQGNRPLGPDLNDVRAIADRTAARRVFRKRLVATPGVVATTDSSTPCSLEISARPVEVPNDVYFALADLRRTWKIEDEELTDAKDVARVARQLSCGFYYRWLWPNDEKDEEWLAARAAWHKAVRHVLRYNSGENLDSPLLVARAAARDVARAEERAAAKAEGRKADPDAYEDELRDDHVEAWRAWDAVRDRWKPHPPKEAVWLSSFLVDDIDAWAASCTDDAPGIVWYEHETVGDALRDRGIPVFGPGKEGDSILQFRGPVCAASVEAHKDGKNLQHFCRNLVICWPSNGTTCEQLLGRTHRDGQRADEVSVELYQHEEALKSAVFASRSDARFVEDAHGARQKLLLATWIGFAGIGQ